MSALHDFCCDDIGFGSGKLISLRISIDEEETVRSSFRRYIAFMVNIIVFFVIKAISSGLVTGGLIDGVCGVDADDLPISFSNGSPVPSRRREFILAVGAYSTTGIHTCSRF